MEEIRFKFSHSKNLTVLEAAGDKLSQIIVNKKKSEKSSSEELQFLWDECRSENPLVCRVACRVLSTLVENGTLEPMPTLSGLLTLAPQVKSGGPSGLVSAIGDILSLQMALDDQTLAYGIACRSHPFVSLLRTSALFWPHVLNQIERFFNHENKMEIRLRSCKFFQPVFMFAFCDPHHHPHFAGLRAGLMDILLSHPQPETEKKGEENNLAKLELTMDVFTWLDFENPESFSENALFLRQLIRLGIPRIQKLPLLTSLLLHCLKVGQDPSVIRSEIEMLVNEEDNAKSPIVYDSVLVMLSACFSYAPVKYHQSLIVLASKVCLKHVPNTIVKNLVITSIIPLLTHRVKLSPEIMSSFRLILNSKPNAEQREVKTFDLETILTDHNIRESLKVAELARKLENSEEENLMQWVDTISFGPEVDRNVVFPMLLSLAYKNNGDELDSKVWESLKSMAIQTPYLLTHPVLSLILFKLSSDCCTKEAKLRLLKILPQLGGDRTCVSFILQMINSLSLGNKNKTNLGHLQLKLLFELWKKEDRIYPNLKQSLEEKATLHEHTFTLNLTKAKLAKEICILKPSQHGADLLPLLSGILNEFHDVKYSSVCTLALEGIAILCQKNVIDIRTTIRVLSPKIWPDPRPDVFVKFLEVISVVTMFDVDNVEYQTFEQDLLAKLFVRYETEPDKIIKSEIMKTISKFKLESFALITLPKFTRTDLKFPPGYNPPVEGPFPSPEDVLKYVPGQCWVKLITESADEMVEDFMPLVQNLLETELTNLPRGVYYLSPALANRGQEPTNFNHFSESSIIREIFATLLAYLAGKITVQKSRIALLMKLLSNERLKRSFPPFNWNLFLPLKSFCFQEVLKLCCKHCSDSSSAKSIVTSALEQKCSKEESKVLFDNLSLYCNHLDEKSLTPFVQDCFHQVFRDIPACVSEAEEMVDVLKDSIEKTSNANLLAVVYELFFSIALNDDEVLELISPLIPLLVGNQTMWQELSDLSHEMNFENFQRRVYMRRYLACHSQDQESRLAYLNSAIEFSASKPEFRTQLNTHLLEAFKANRDGDPKDNRRWLLELMGHIRSVSRLSVPKPDLFRTLFNSFALAIVVFSYTDFLCSNETELCKNADTTIFELLPIAVNRILFHQKSWKSFASPLSEWMIQLKEDKKNVGDDIRNVLTNCFPAFKNCEKYSEASVWSRLVP